jgi:hypothetical protein
MLKNPMVADNTVHKTRGTACLENQARLAPLLKFDKRAAIRDCAGRYLAVDEHRISELFQGYFNNKMTLLFFLIQGKNFVGNPRLVESSSRFIEDIYHHMLSAATQKEQRWVFKWLGIFFRKLPDVSVVQRNKAKGFILCVYDAVGLFLKSNI